MCCGLPSIDRIETAHDPLLSPATAIALGLLAAIFRRRSAAAARLGRPELFLRQGTGPRAGSERPDACAKVWKGFANSLFAKARPNGAEETADCRFERAVLMAEAIAQFFILFRDIKRAEQPVEDGQAIAHVLVKMFRIY